ncbi:MAG TPA: hypothetical protein VFG45_01635 [Candidatus Nitrosocosmicus sp.]|jgi:TM2 domain-containing membrane protein YozV|nr:hypothetical protein [Candidatus Nitrosocosmicus sp.]
MVNKCKTCGNDLLPIRPDFCSTCNTKQDEMEVNINRQSPSPSIKRAIPLSYPSKSRKPSTVLTISILCGLIGFSGLGHIYAGRSRRGIGILVLGWGLVILSLTFVPASLLIYFVYLIIQAIDAYKISKVSVSSNSSETNEYKPIKKQHYRSENYNYKVLGNSSSNSSSSISSGTIKGIVVLLIIILWIVMGISYGMLLSWQYWIFLPMLVLVGITGKRKDIKRAGYYAGSGM